MMMAADDGDMETHVRIVESSFLSLQHGNSIKLDGKLYQQFSIAEIGIISTKSSAIESIHVCVCVCSIFKFHLAETSDFYLIIFMAFFMNIMRMGKAEAVGMMTSCLSLYDAYSAVQPFDIIHDAIKGTAKEKTAAASVSIFNCITLGEKKPQDGANDPP